MEQQNKYGGQSFPFKLFKQFPKNQNLIFSPSSIYTTLSMAALGSEGNTLEEFKRALYFLNKEQLISNLKQQQLIQDKIPEIQIGNKLYHNIDRIEEQFAELMNNHFKGNLELADFKNNLQGQVDKINKWVSVQTKGMIKEIVQVQNVSSLTKLVLINAIYFRDDWKYKFNERNTKKDLFYQRKGELSSTKQVDMMYQHTEFLYYEDEQVQYLNIPYNNQNVKMEILLPKNIELEQLEQIMTPQYLENVQKLSKLHKVKLFLPRFKIEDKSSKSLLEILKQIGLSDCFSDTLANFYGIVKDEQLFIYQILHKAMIEVNEKGTKAAASTTALFMTECKVMEIPEALFYCNNPFLFLISDTNSYQCFFMGRVTDPEQIEEAPNQMIQFFKSIINKIF